MQVPDCTHKLLIIGASVRAAIESARRAGLEPRGADLFADVDAVENADITRITDYPRGMLQVVDVLAPTAVIYTGAFENHPEVIAQIAQHTRVLGNDADVLRQVRSPERVAAAFTTWDIPHPVISLSRPDADRHWMRKAFHSTAGHGVRRWHADDTLPPTCYAQEYIEGTACAAIYVAAAKGCQLLGVTEQLVNRPWTAAPPFAYAGSMGPRPLDGNLRLQFERIGECLAEHFQLTGLFGVDAILRDHTVYAVEVNPRYTASVEVLERATGIASLSWHVAACRGRWSRHAIGAPTALYGKAILFADREVSITGDLVSAVRRAQLPSGAAAFSDIPHAGELVQRCHPIMTVWAQGTDAELLEMALQKRAADVRQLLGGVDSAPN